jgi:DNA polymerase-3 subunit delta'
MDEFPESDRLLEFPAPREQSAFVGNVDAEQKLLRAYLGGKMHHAWILGGPRGIGKATLAYRFARFVLCNGQAGQISPTPKDLSVDPEDPVFRRIAVASHADLFVARREYDRKSKRLRRDISADTVRQISRFFGRTSGEGGWRVCIVDAADDMNRTAANALLKILEEPPNRSLFLLVCHAPLRLLPTVRSRCVRLDLQPLPSEDLHSLLCRQLDPEQVPSGKDFDQLYAMCQGSAGQALTMLSGNGWSIYKRLNALLQRSSRNNRTALHEFAESIAARGADDDYRAFCTMVLDWTAKSARDNAILRGNEDGAHRDPGALATAWQKIAHSIDRANALNLDRKQTVLQTLRLLDDTAV